MHLTIRTGWGKHCLLLCGMIAATVLISTVAHADDTLSEHAPRKQCNIVLITIDTLRADHLSCYGYKRKTSPTIDALAEKGVLFKQVISPSSWTVPSMASLFLSLYPAHHGVIHGIVYEKNKTLYEQEVLPESIPTLAEILKGRGYTTFGVASNLHLGEQFGFARGFDYFQCLSFSPANVVHEVITSWGQSIKQADPFFLWVHYFDPHWPYVPMTPWIDHYATDSFYTSAYIQDLTKKLVTEEHLKNIESILPVVEANPSAAHFTLSALYDSQISYVDFYIQKLIDTLALADGTLIVITSDHGEEFLEHGTVGHGNNLYQESLRVPLVVKLPHTSQKDSVESQATLLDVMPTVLHLAGIDPPEHALGKSLWTDSGPAREQGEEYSFAELDERSILKAILTPEWKYIYNYQDTSEQLYNIRSDALETRNLSSTNRTQRDHLKNKLFQWVSRAQKYPTKKHSFQLSPADKDKLKGLGYIQ